MDAAFEGYGPTLDGKMVDMAKNETVTIIVNDLCDDILKANSSRHLINKAKLKGVLKDGVTEELLCTMGKYDEDTGKYTVSTKPANCEVHCMSAVSCFCSVKPAARPT